MLFGAGGHARSVEDVITSTGAAVVAFVGTAAEAIPAPLVLSEAEFAISELTSMPIIVAIGDNTIRGRVWATLDERTRAGAVIASTASVAGSAVIGAGTVVHHQAHVGPAARIGESVIINTGAIVEHDVVVAVGAHVAPGAVVLGAAVVGEGALIGSGARVLPGVRVGRGAVVGAGAVVSADVEEDMVVVGIPARVHARSGGR